MFHWVLNETADQNDLSNNDRLITQKDKDMSNESDYEIISRTILAMLWREAISFPNTASLLVCSALQQSSPRCSRLDKSVWGKLNFLR